VRFHRDRGITIPGSKRKQGPLPLKAVMRSTLPLPHLLFTPANAAILVSLNPLCTEHMVIILAHIVHHSTRLMQAGGQEDMSRVSQTSDRMVLWKMSWAQNSR